MRRRLIRGTLLVVVVAVAVLGVPLALLARHQVWSSARDTLRQEAASVATGLEDRIDVGAPVDLSRYAAAMAHRRITLTRADSAPVSAGRLADGARLRASVQIAGSTITVEAARSVTARRAREVTLLVAAIAALSAAAAVALALRMARRLTAPLAGLVTRAEAIGHGDFAPAAVSSGIPEIDGVSQVLERSAQRVAALVALQRDFAADAAHQLRTPLTGIALRLEEVVRIGDEQVRQEAEGAVTQVERLDRVITSLLARARGDSAEPTLFDLAELVQHEAVGWGRVLAQHHRPLVLDLSAGTCVVARREHLVGILTSLLDNALVHGWGPVHVGVARSQEQALLIVRDEGPGVPAALAHDIFQRQVSGNHGTGIGLALASSLAVAEGGLLELSHESATFVLTLPSAPRVGQR